MKIEQYIDQIIPELYSFAHALFPDSLQADQIVIDSVNSVLLHDKNVEKYFEALGWQKAIEVHEDEFLNRIKANIFYKIYTLSSKRLSQMKNSKNSNENTLKRHNAFHVLDSLSKAVLFLKYRLGLPIEIIEKYLRVERENLMSVLVLSKERLCQLTIENTF